MKIVATTLLLVLALATPSRAQFGGVLKRAEAVRDEVKSFTISDEDEDAIGSNVSARVRQRYGVAQDRALHRYVSLVGMVLAKASSRPSLSWKFIVLDTDGVNAFAAPGGYIHITRGALALVRDEAELAGVLAHEITHVTEKHTIGAIQKQKMVKAGAGETLKGNATLLNAYVDRAFEMVYAGFGRAEELESDAKGLVLANAAGYAPGGLGGFLARLNERNKSATEKQGLFASHPEMSDRMNRLTKQIAADKLTATAVDAERYRTFVTFQPKAQTEIAQVESGSAGLAAGGKPEAKEPPKKSGAFGLSTLSKPAGGAEKSSAEVTASGGSRGVDTERNAKGGSNPSIVAVTLSAADLTTFKKEGGLR